MASEAGDEEASTAASVGSEGGGVNSSSNSSVKATGGDDDVMVVEDQQEAPGEGDKQEQQKLPDGWTVHSICKRPYDATIYEEVVGGRPGQDPSTAHAYVVWHKEGKTPLCLICPQHKQHTGKSPYPGNFLGHLRTHKEFTDYEAGRGKGDGKSGKGGGGACTCGGGGTVKWSKERKARVRRLLICMLVVHGRPFEMLRDELFQALVEELSCKAMECPSTDTLRKEVEQVAKNVRADLRDKIKNAQPGTRSLSADGWTAGNQTGRMGMILRFVDKDTLEFMSVVLGCMLWDEDHDTAGTAAMMRKVLQRWELTAEDVDMACTDNAAVMKACIREHFQGWSWLGCTPHTLQLPMSRLLEGSYKTVSVAGPDGGRRSETAQQQWAGPGPEAVHLLFKRVRVIINFHTNRPKNKLRHLLHNAAVAAGEVEGEHVGAFLKPAETRWTGLYLMGKSLYDNHNYTLEFSYANPGNTDCCLSPADYQLLGQLLAVLEPFKDAMDLFQTTDSVAISLVYPELLVIIEFLEAAELVVGGKGVAVASLHPAVVELRKLLRDEIFQRFFALDNTVGEVYKNFVLYGSATYLDPRNVIAQRHFHTKTRDGRTIFQHMGQALVALANKNKAYIVAFLQRELARYKDAPWVTRAALLGAGAAPAAATGTAAARGDSPPPAKRPRDWRSQMAAEFLGGGSCSGEGGGGAGSAGGGGGSRLLVITEAMVPTLLREEMEKYAAYWTLERARVHGLPLPDTSMCPLKQFWAVHRESMPVLSFLAHTTLNIRPSSADCERLFSKAGFVFSERRQCMDAVRLDDMLTIQGNWNKKYLKFTVEEQNQKAADRLAHNKAISDALKASYAGKQAAKKSKKVQMKLDGRKAD